MTKHTLTIEIDVPDDMLAAVHDAAHRAIGLMQADVMRDLRNFNQGISLIDDEEAKASLRAHRQLTAKAASIVINALSEITQAMNEANSAWMRSRNL